MKIFNVEFFEPYYLFLPILALFFLFLFYKNRNKYQNFSAFNDLKQVFKRNSFLFYFRIFLIISAFFMFSFIFANPNKVNTDEKDKRSGIDIVLAFDVSESMNATDLLPTRLESAKKLIINFLQKQKTNRVWLVLFAWKPFVWIPLTFDYKILEETVKNISTETINQYQFPWTAIWDAILMGKNMFDKDDKNREKTIVLITDWDANTWAEPKVASISARDDWIKIYSVWIWGKQDAFVNYKTWPFEQKAIVKPLNDVFLKEISEITNWKFFRATDNKSFENIFTELEKLQKTDIEEKTKKTYRDIYDSFAYFLSFLLFLLFCSFLNLRIFFKNKKEK